MLIGLTRLPELAYVFFPCTWDRQQVEGLGQHDGWTFRLVFDDTHFELLPWFVGRRGHPGPTPLGRQLSPLASFYIQYQGLQDRLLRTAAAVLAITKHSFHSHPGKLPPLFPAQKT